jgi:hypothetical protein
MPDIPPCAASQQKDIEQVKHSIDGADRWQIRMKNGVAVIFTGAPF